MGKYILADNQELTRLALISLIKQDEENTLYVATDRAGLVELLKEHEDATVLLDFTLFDFADAEQLLIIGERFALSQWILVSDELTPAFIRQMVYSSHQFSIIFKDGPLSEVREALQTVSRHQRYISPGGHHQPTAGRGRTSQYPDRNGDGDSPRHRSGQVH